MSDLGALQARQVDGTCVFGVDGVGGRGCPRSYLELQFGVLHSPFN